MVALGAAALSKSHGAHAQQRRKLPRIGVIVPGDPKHTRRDAFRSGLRERGWTEGRDILVEYRSIESTADQVRAVVDELVALDMDAIVAASNPVIFALKRATQKIPIVMALVGDPVGAGFVASLARPGGNITGFSILAEGLSAKRLEILREIDPRISRVAVLRNLAIPTHGVLLKDTETAARALRMTLVPLDYRNAGDLQEVLKSLTRERADGLVVLPDATTSAKRTLIASVASQSGLPAMYPWAGFVDAGGLAAYGPNPNDLWRRSATYVDRILKGARPADLPIEQPTRFELVVNLKVAKTLRLTIPQTVLLRADRVIE